jgi:hypothetical protein
VLTTQGMVKSHKIGTIRSQASNNLINLNINLFMKKIQRLDGSGSEVFGYKPMMT